MPHSSQELNGMLVLDKPRGIISKDVSRQLSKYLRHVKHGHVGTLDPEAEGVLPLLLGRATRLQDLLVGKPKTYIFDVEFGYETSTLDIEGEIIGKAPWNHIKLAQIEDLCANFVGPMRQVPPIYSAVKFKGKPLYFYARNNLEAEVDLDSLARTIKIYSCKLLSYEAPVARVEVRCSKGTYVRVIAKDLAKALHTLGTVTRLRRTESAGITISDSLSVDKIKVAFENVPDGVYRYIVPMDRINIGLQTLVLDSAEKKRLFNGLSLHIHDLARYTLDRSMDEETSSVLLKCNDSVIGLGSVIQLADGKGIKVVLKRSLQ